METKGRHRIVHLSQTRRPALTGIQDSRPGAEAGRTRLMHGCAPSFPAPRRWGSPLLMRSAAGTEKVEELLSDRIGRSIVAHEIADIHDLNGLERHRNDAAVRWIDSCCDVVAIML